MRDVRGVLWAALVATVSLPIVLGVVLGLGLLLEALGDSGGWYWCRRLALVVGAAWAFAIIGTTVCSAVLSLATTARGVGERHGGDEPRLPG